MPRVLIIDAEAQVGRVLRMTFESGGYEVGDAPDELYRDNPADVVITDLGMSDRKGLETIREPRLLPVTSARAYARPPFRKPLSC